MLTAVTLVPERATVCGLPAALSVIVSVPAIAPAVEGVNTTEIWQAAPATRLAPQVFVSAKSPPAAMELSASAAVPVLLSVMDCGELEAPCATLPNSMLVPDNAAFGAAELMVKVSAADVPPPGAGF